MANDALNLRLQRFATGLLSWHGALVDWPEGALEGLAVLPGDAASTLGTGEETRVSLQPVPDGVSANLSTDFLERIEPLLAGAASTVAWRMGEAYLKKSDPTETVAKAFDWLNARVRVRSSRACETEYHVWFFRALLASEDRWEDVIQVTLNARSGAEIALPEMAGMGGGEWDRNPQAFHGEATWARASETAWQKARDRAAPFLARMDERLQRDRKRLENYYKALLKEKRRVRAAAPGLEAAREATSRNEERRRAVTLELERKTDELNERYAVAGELSAMGCLRIFLPTLAIDLAVQRKTAVAERTVYWNPALKAMEPLACTRCGSTIFTVAFTDGRVEPTCPSCHAARGGGSGRP